MAMQDVKITPESVRKLIYRASVDADELALCVSVRVKDVHLGLGFRENHRDSGVFFIEWPVRLQVGFDVPFKVKDWRAAKRTDNPESLQELQARLERQLADNLKEVLLQPALFRAAQDTAARAGVEGAFCHPLWFDGQHIVARPFPKSPLEPLYGGPSWEPLFDEAVFFGYDYAEPPERLSFPTDIFTEFFFEEAQEALKTLKLWYAVELKIEDRLKIKKINVQPHGFMAELMAKRRPLPLLQPGKVGRPSLKAQDLIIVLECAIAIKDREPGLSNRSLHERVSGELLQLEKGFPLTSEGVRYALSRAFKEAGLEVRGTYRLEDLRHALKQLKASL